MINNKARFIIQWWWVVLFVFSVSLLYKQCVHAKIVVHQSLLERKSDLEKQKNDALRNKEELLLKLASQNDPKWVEMTLMKGLGVVPEGQTKVLFVEKR
ncbi:MAG: hypothetical protein FJZ56_06385 [Chlamydiae bacterium]|nr:hypothetical protein [Chlamydiota bacterium]